MFAEEADDWHLVTAPEPFDVAVLRIRGGVHVGVCLGSGRLLHMPRGASSVIEPLSKFRHVLEGFYRRSG